MADPNVVPGDQLIRGALTVVGSFVGPAGCITNANVLAAAGIAASKLQHAHRAQYAQESATSAAAESRVIHTVIGATASVQAVRVGCVVVAVGGATATVDIKKNGTTILTGVVTLNSSNAVRVPVNGTISVAAAVAGDVFEVVVTATAGGGTLAKGIFVSMDIFEAAT